MITIVNTNLHAQAGSQIREAATLESVLKRVEAKKNIRILSKNTYKNFGIFTPIESMEKFETPPAGQYLKLQFKDCMDQVKEITVLSSTQIYTTKGFVKASSLYVSNLVVDEAGRFNKLVNSERINIEDVGDVYGIEMAFNHNVFTNGILIR
jgi:hypothetical protein